MQDNPVFALDQV